MSHFSCTLHWKKGELVNLLIITSNKFNTFPFFTGIYSIYMVIHIEKEGFTIRDNSVGSDSTRSIVKYEKEENKK